ncbi:hypothetical protein Bca52824_092887 [Brassica carinata]|uniref:Uncharacterized protein n=1 Tax=Brassica carinata TaxID=52824 RepID=A0A8X7P6V6_BRACI|nr:hypothetical protein Bca52824_092887 [Brassica carinata]
MIRLILSKLVIMKVAVETKENIVSPKERLNARNATFYIKYKFCPNKSRRPCKVDGCRATRERIAIIRRSLDKLSGLLTLSFHGHSRQSSPDFVWTMKPSHDSSMKLTSPGQVIVALTSNLGTVLTV